MANSRYKNALKKRDGGYFISIPTAVLDGAAYLSLSPYAVKLLIDIASQYRGDNNGDMCATWKVMKRRGWKSEDTLNKVKRELLESQLIYETRKGARPNKCSLFALTWFALDDCNGKLEISPRNFPRGAYKLKDALQPIGKIARLNTDGVADIAG